MPDRDFPKVPDHREASYATVESTVLREMIERTLFSICDDETRFHLNGVFFESGGSKCRMVSTDGHRLSVELELEPDLHLIDSSEQDVESILQLALTSFQL